MQLADWFGEGSFVSYSTLTFTPEGRPLPDYVTIIGVVTARASAVVQLRWDDGPRGLPASVPAAVLEADRLRIESADGDLVWVDNTGLYLPRNGTLIVGPGWNVHPSDPTDRVRVSWRELAPADAGRLASEVVRWSRPFAATGNETPLPQLSTGGAGATRPPTPPVSVAGDEPSEVGDSADDGHWLDQPPPTALLSWGHQNEDWTAEEAAAWERQVIDVATVLREAGIDVDIDLIHDADTGIDWTRWGPAAIADREYTFIVMSRGWAQRWEGTNTPTLGAGAVAEADALHGRFAANQDDFQRRTKIILLPGVTKDVIPEDLTRLQRFPIDPDDRYSTDDLVRHITNQPTYKLPPVGPLRQFEPVAIGADTRTHDLVAGSTPSLMRRMRQFTSATQLDWSSVRPLNRRSVFAASPWATGPRSSSRMTRADPSEKTGQKVRALLRRVRAEHPDQAWRPGRCTQCARPLAVEADSEGEWLCSMQCHDRWYRLLYTVIDPGSASIHRSTSWAGE